MQKRHDHWHSPILSVDMPIVTYGHWGPPLLLFPTAAADCYEYERFGLIDSIAHHLEAGRLKLYSIDSINKHSWMNDGVPPAERARRQALYDAYLYEEVAPFIVQDCQTPDIGITTSGASFGAYHAINTLLKHPDRFRRTIAMSGAYDVKSYSSGYYDDNIYFNNPVDYLPNLNDSYILDQIRRCDINILTGQGAWEAPEQSRWLSQLLWNKGIPHNLDMWGHEWPHDWPTWKVMLDQYISKLF